MRRTTKEEFVMEREVVREALALYGQEKQLSVAMEECAELIVEISHRLRGRGNEEDLASEVADVELVCQTLRMLLGDERVDSERRIKTTRLAARVERAYETHNQTRLSTPTAPEVVGHGDEGRDVAEEPAT
jgi:hypothetical protein